LEIKYTKQFLNKLEDLFTETDYQLRYERGTFNSGYCILNNTKVAVVNKFYTTEGKINCLLEILRSIQVDPDGLSDKSKKLFSGLLQTTIEL